MLATAESCTGGLVASALTEIAGSSVALDRGFVTYSNVSKMQMLGVPEAMLPQLAREAMQQQRLLVNNPREVTEADALAIYRAAY